MASIFTFDPDPPRVSSPWIPTEELVINQESGEFHGRPAQPGLLSEYTVTKLQAEPQQGPTEYKLHLLLKPRRQYTYMSTAKQASGSQQLSPRDASVGTKASAPTSSIVNQTRQQRLQHLTTQLLWRLQQSSPYHASSSKELTIPKLPDDNFDLASPVQPNVLIPGLEESRGALYEIGVSDDGTLVGLTTDEINESILTLRIMAASLGCTVDVVRMVIVGDCEWVDQRDTDPPAGSDPLKIARHTNLWVAEALVTPYFGPRPSESSNISSQDSANGAEQRDSKPVVVPSRGSSSTPQLRVTLTGPTTSGKSTLLGTLSTGTLDNGRGKSRLSLLKHRHELVSGVTSSVAQELIGYKSQAILNFSQGNIESWLDIHDCSEGGRLVFVSDSGGHPRYRRTVLRGLMNWAPHWSILCIAADDSDALSNGSGGASSIQDDLGNAATGVDLVQAHLTLSLKLDVPMAVVVTKLDLASKDSLHKLLVKILAAIKEAGRIPKILQPDQIQREDLACVPPEDYIKVQSTISTIIAAESLNTYVPIVLTSAVKGIGIGLMHALLESLPLSPPPTSSDYFGMALNPEQPKCLFHVDDTFNLPATYSTLTGTKADRTDGNRGVIVSGHSRFGSFSVGDKIVVGPFPSVEDDVHASGLENRCFSGSYGLSISHPSSADLARIAMKNAVAASTIAGEWHSAQIVSIRNLRLPVQTLEPGQAGSIGMVFDPDRDQVYPNSEIPNIRRGMVIAIPSDHMADTGLSLQAASGFTVTFSDATLPTFTAGSLINVYIASVRAAARVLRLSRGLSQSAADSTEVGDDDDNSGCMFSLGDETKSHNIGCNDTKQSTWEVCLELLHNREWVELGSRVILLEGGRQDRSGLEGFVGKIIEIVD